MSKGPRTYGQLCGLASALDLVGERWTLLVIRELFRGPKRFGELLDGLGGMGTNLLSARLKSLESAGVIERVTLPAAANAPGYALSERGRALQPILEELSLWGIEDMERTLDGPEVRAAWAAMTMRAHMDRSDQAPPPGIYAFRVDEERFWLRVGGGVSELFDGLPPEDPSVTATFDTDRFFAVATGNESLAESGARIEGDRESLARLFRTFRIPPPAQTVPS